MPQIIAGNLVKACRVAGQELTLKRIGRFLQVWQVGVHHYTSTGS